MNSLGDVIPVILLLALVVVAPLLYDLAAALKLTQ